MSVSYHPLRILLPVLLAAITATATGGRVTEVFDGRSFALDDGARVRLLGVAAPRVYESGGDIALEVLAKFVRGRTVRLETDGPEADADGWLLRYVFVGDTFVNALVVARGYGAVTLDDSGYRRLDTLRNLERTAARVEKGLWPFDLFPPPPPSAQAIEAAPADPWLETVAYDQAQNYYGRIVQVVGSVVATYRTDRVFIMNFHQDYRRYFKAVVFPSDIEKFPLHPEDHYKKRVVRVTGLVREYQGAPQIILNDPSQIEVLE